MTIPLWRFAAQPGRTRRVPRSAVMDREELERRWLRLTRETLPALGAARGWPVRVDHCFQRILLDNAIGGRWYDHVAGRPAYRHIAAEKLAAAVALAEAAVAGDEDMAALNRRSLAWRGKAPLPARSRTAREALGSGGP